MSRAAELGKAIANSVIERVSPEYWDCVQDGTLKDVLFEFGTPNEYDLEAILVDVFLELYEWGASWLHLHRAYTSLGYAIQLLELDPSLTVHCYEYANTSLTEVFLQPILDELAQHAPGSADGDASSRPVVPSVASSVLPVRLRFAGGWSDTPPYCVLYGGRVVNMAVRVEGKPPVKARVELTRSNKEQDSDLTFRMVHEESGSSLDVCGFDGLRQYNDPEKPFALHKAVLALCFYPHCISERVLSLPITAALIEDIHEHKAVRREGLRSQVPHGGCVTLTTGVHLPQGSGLGTSSILILACIRAIASALPRESALVRALDSSPDLEHTMVLCVEQMLSTGGGWQDSFGGGVPGLKSTVGLILPHTELNTSDKSPLPSFEVTPIALDADHRTRLDEVLVCVFTGVRRLAKKRLTNVSTSCTILDAKALACVHGLAEIAGEQTEILAEWNEYPVASDGATTLLRKFGESLTRTRILDTDLDAGHIPAGLEPLARLLDHMCAGWDMVGSGAGGFMIGVLEDHTKKDEFWSLLDARRTSLPPDARWYDVSVDWGDVK